MNAVYERLSELLTTKFGVGKDEVRPDVSFVDLDLDSLALVELAMVVEGIFGVNMGDSELDPENTVADAVELLASKGAEA
jgi:acyl carrier protein